MDCTYGDTKKVCALSALPMTIPTVHNFLFHKEKKIKKPKNQNIKSSKIKNPSRAMNPIIQSSSSLSDSLKQTLFIQHISLKASRDHQQSNDRQKRRFIIKASLFPHMRPIRQRELRREEVALKEGGVWAEGNG